MEFGLSLAAQFAVLLRRSMRSVYRDVGFLVVLVAEKFSNGLLVVLIYARLGFGQASVQSRLGSLFFVLLSNTFPVVMMLLDRLPSEKAFYTRERRVGAHQTGPYFLSKIVADLPAVVLLPLAYAFIVYPLVGFAPGAPYFLFPIILVGIVLGGVSIAYLIAILSPTYQASMILAPNVLVLFIVLAGFYQTIESIPGYLAWVPVISWVRYSFEGAVVNEFSAIDHFTCFPDEEIAGQCPIPDGATVLRNFGLTATVGSSIGYTYLIVMVQYFLGYFFLRFWSKPQVVFQTTTAASTRWMGPASLKRTFRRRVARTDRLHAEWAYAAQRQAFEGAQDTDNL
jgi:ABC-type multidrug transport system permease subunit